MTGKRQPKTDKLCLKTQYPNLFRYRPSGTYYARFKGKGKGVRRSLNTDVLSVAKLRLTDMTKDERSQAESRAETADVTAAYNRVAWC